MYARVAVASNALDLGDLQPPIANAVHGTLVEILLAHGRLVFTSPQEALEFIQAVRNTAVMPPGARTRWENLLVHLRQSGRVVFADSPGQTSLADVNALNVLRARWGGEADVAVIATSACTSLGVSPVTGILSDPSLNPDVAVPAAAPSAPAFARLTNLQLHPFAPHGSPREVFWETVLEPIATGAVTATILDGYLFNRISEIAHGRVRAPRGGEHVTWLLEHVDRVMAGGATVRLIGNAANVRPGDDENAIAEAIRDQLGLLKVGRLARVQVFLGQVVRGRRFPHDRHIRFSTGSAIKVPAGFDRLRDQRIWDHSGMWWSYHWQASAVDGLRADERAAESLAGHPATFALSR